jgi:hypothetical protein
MRAGYLIAVLLSAGCGARTELESDRSPLPAQGSAGTGEGARCSASWDEVTWDDSLEEAAEQLWTGSATNTWAVVSGDVAKPGADSSYRDHWDGSHWTRTLAEHDPSARFGAEQIWAAENLHAFAGSSKNLQRWSGKTWTDWANSPGCSAIAGTAEDDLWCATDNELWRFDGAKWTPQEISGIVGILASTRDEVWVWGTRGASHFDGVRWSLELANPVVQVSASEPTDVWALQDGNVLHSTGPGSRWTQQNPTGGRILGVWSQSRTNTWVVAAGAAMRWDGTSWALMPLPRQDERRLISGSGEDIWIAGTQLLAHGRPACR